MKQLFVSIALFIKNKNEVGTSFWMQTRNEDGPLNGLWEFPGGKWEVGETAKEAMIREVKEEVGLVLDPENDTILEFKTYPYETNFKQIYLHTFLVKTKSVPKDKGKWFELSFDMRSHPLKGKIPEINHLIIDEALSYLRENDL